MHPLNFLDDFDFDLLTMEPEHRGMLPSGSNQLRQSDGGGFHNSSAAAAVSDNHQFPLLPTGVSSYPQFSNHTGGFHDMSSHQRFCNDTGGFGDMSSYQRLLNHSVGFRDSPSIYDFNLESDFNRLCLTDPSVRGANCYNSFGGAGGVADSSIRSSLALAHPQFTGDAIQRMRGQFAESGQIGLQMEQLNYQALADPQVNTEPISIARNFYGESEYGNLYTSSARNGLSEYGNLYASSARNGLSEYGNLYTSPRRSLSAAATGYRPRAHRNGFRNGHNHQLNFNRSTPNLLIETDDSAYSMSDRARYRSTFKSLDELRGRISIAAKDQTGCRFLQNKFDEGKPEDIRLIFSEVKDHVCELMVDQFGNYLVQKLFEVCSEEQITQLLLIVVNDEWKFKDICIDMHGTRAVQKLVENLTTPEQKSVAISVLRCITVALTKSMNGHHVIQHCLKFFSTEDTKQILDVVADNCLDIATDKSGCCVLQQCLAHAHGESRERLIAEISSNALILSEHPYGNYVVQYVLGLRMPQVTAEILAQLSGRFVSLSLNKYGSNVVEKCLKESDGEHVLRIINEIMHSPNILRVLQDPYGNYVAQSALDISRGPARANILHKITVHYPFLHSHPHGKRVLARTKGNKSRV